MSGWNFQLLLDTVHAPIDPGQVVFDDFEAPVQALIQIAEVPLEVTNLVNQRSRDGADQSCG
jgi:hypothetical protein